MSILSFTSAPLDFRLRGRWVAATVDEVKNTLAASEHVGENPDETLRPAIDALLATTAYFEPTWRRLMETLDSTGVPGHFLQPLVPMARTILDSGNELLSLLRENTHGYREEFERTADAFARIERELVALEGVLVPGNPDDKDIDRGLAEAERGEGKDSGSVLAHFLSTGEL